MRRSVLLWAYLPALALVASPAWALLTERVSVASDGTQADSSAIAPAAISADGRYVAFTSESANLVPGDTNACADVFRHDLVTGATERVSVGSAGIQGTGHSWARSISSNGRYVAFFSMSTEFVPGYPDSALFVHDCVSGTTERVGPAALFGWAALSGDGRYVAFDSDATDLVPGDTNATGDIFVRDRQTGTTERVSVASDGTEANGVSLCPDISADGRYVVFESEATNLVPDGTPEYLSHIFMRDRQLGTTELVSIASDGMPSDGRSLRPSITDDGRYVAFDSEGTNLVSGDTNAAFDVFVRDRETGATERVSVGSLQEQANAGSGDAALSADGRYVAFTSLATNLMSSDINGSSDIFLRDRQAGTTECISLGVDGAQADGSSTCWGISANGRRVVIVSAASNLVLGDTNSTYDAFVLNLWRFWDVPPEHWAFDEVEACADANVVKGFDDETYQPEWTVTRDQMAVYIARALAGGDANVPDPGCTTPPFTDVACNHWAQKYIQYAVSQGVVEGYPEGDYRPDLEVTRDQMAVYVARAMVAPTGEAALADYVPSDPRNFPDVPSTGYGDDGTEPFWAYKHIEYCVENGVVQGYLDGSYHPEAVVTRDQMAAYVARAFGLVD